jgi:hypothetical protein
LRLVRATTRLRPPDGREHSSCWGFDQEGGVATTQLQKQINVREWYVAHVSFNAVKLAYDQTLSRYTVLCGTVFTDMSANLTLAEDNPLLPGAPRDVFGIKTRQIA